MRLRVLHVYSGNLYGGIERLLVTLARQRRLCPAMDSIFALCFKGRLSEELEASGAAVHWLGEVRASRPLSVWCARRRLGALLRAESVDVVVCHLSWSQAMFGGAARTASRPLVAWQHGPTDGGHWLERWARATTPDFVLCNSQFTASRRHRRYQHIPTEAIYYPVEPSGVALTESERRALRLKFETPPTATVIVQVSRLEEWKGHLLNLEALAALRDLPNWVCWQVGAPQRPKEAAYWERIKRAGMRLGIADRVRFLGFRSDIQRVLAAADIYCQPNTGPEPFGYAFVEALYGRLPVVTTDIGGAREIVDDSCGILVPAGDTAALAAALRQLVTDRVLRTRLGAGGPDRARKLCDPTTQMARLYDVLVRVSDSFVAPK